MLLFGYGGVKKIPNFMFGWECIGVADVCNCVFVLLSFGAQQQVVAH